ncbi:MAG: response regulator transcription factor [Bryobacterales bacterium]|nr:response regulator transcription factor [Bryobacterales bacterium]
MSAQVLLVEDDVSLTSVLRDTLESAGHAVTWVSSGTEALQAWSPVIELVILDLMLPGYDGLTVCGHWRQKGIETPILILSARGGRDDRIQGLTAGADDYLTKPFDPEELLARVQALLRRARYRNSADTTHRIGDVTVHFLSGMIYRGEQRIFLSTKELQLLHYLVRHATRVVSREELLREVWGCGASLTRTVDMHVATLRQKVEADPKVPALIRTVRGEGYRLGVEVKDSLPSDSQQPVGGSR